MNRVLSGIAPSGNFTLGNYLGALRHWVSFQDGHDAFYCVVDLHALTSEIDPAAVRANTLDAALNLLAIGLDPERCTLFVQSHVPEHTRLTWLLECTATMGELRRMTQFKDKGQGQEAVRVGLFTYPVPDGGRHPPLRRRGRPGGRRPAPAPGADPGGGRSASTTATARPSSSPKPPSRARGARVMDLQHPERKMSKSVDSPLGHHRPARLRRGDHRARCARRSPTPTGRCATTGPPSPVWPTSSTSWPPRPARSPAEVAAGYERYGDLKNDVATALCELLAPGPRAPRAARGRPAPTSHAVLADGARRAPTRWPAATYARAADAMGLLARDGRPVR